MLSLIVTSSYLVALKWLKILNSEKGMKYHGIFKNGTNTCNGILLGHKKELELSIDKSSNTDESKNPHAKCNHWVSEACLLGRCCGHKAQLPLRRPTSWTAGGVVQAQVPPSQHTQLLVNAAPHSPTKSPKELLGMLKIP